MPPTGVRPTSDRVREALSRGAMTAVLVERDPRACGVITTNVSTTGLRGALVRRAAVTAFLRRPTDSVDPVLVDPPLRRHRGRGRRRARRPGAWLADGALVVVERDARTRTPAWPDAFVPEEPREHGETVLHLATHGA